MLDDSNHVVAIPIEAYLCHQISASLLHNAAVGTVMELRHGQAPEIC